MFVTAIERANDFTRPLHIVARSYGSPRPIPGAGSLIVVNADGWALTCRHIVEHLQASEAIAQQYSAFKAELAAGRGRLKERHLLKQLTAKYGYEAKTTVQILNNFVNCVDTFSRLDFLLHPEVDLALLRFVGFSELAVTTFPVFGKDGSWLKQGRLMCRFGYPFPEFTNFSYDQTTDELTWTSTGQETTPWFPIEGMVTRHLQHPDARIWGFEMSTPGLRGQSGGPVIDGEGKVWGVQSATSHLDLDFDVDQEVIRDGLVKRVKDSAFLHVGHCIHIDTIKSFMRNNGVSYREA